MSSNLYIKSLDERLRMANAFMRGKAIDRYFCQICDRLGIDAERAITAPFAAIEAAEATLAARAAERSGERT